MRKSTKIIEASWSPKPVPKFMAVQEEKEWLSSLRVARSEGYLSFPVRVPDKRPLKTCLSERPQLQKVSYSGGTANALQITLESSKGQGHMKSTMRRGSVVNASRL